MKSFTRYGVAKQAWHKGLAPAVIFGCLTYWLYRYSNMEGFQLGYKIGTPDEHDIEQANGDLSKLIK